MKPYFKQDGVTIYHGACVDVLGTMAPRSVKIVITDPPYTARVHSGQSKGLRGKHHKQAKHEIDFSPISDESLDAAFAAISRVSSRWVLATTCSEHAAILYSHPPSGLRPIRTGVWVKIGAMPQMTGDRPSQGWEAVAIMHADGPGRMRWNGGGRSAVWTHRAEMNGEYPTQKPEPLINDFISDFADPSDDILDPFMGSGTTLLCGWRRGHRVTGCDIREAACEIAAKRIEQAMRQGRMPFVPAPTRKDQVGLGF